MRIAIAALVATASMLSPLMAQAPAPTPPATAPAAPAAAAPAAAPAAAAPAAAPAAAAPAAAPAAGDPAAGERVFAQCRACHQVGPTARNVVGPQLNGLFGRKAGSVAGFNYSPAYKTPAVAEKVWSPENFALYIRNPREVTPGTRMVFAGIRSENQIADLIAYLRQFDAEGKRAQ